MYTPLIEDHPEKRSRGKSVFTFPLIFLFILVGVASTRHLLNVNTNNDSESMLAEPNIVPEYVEEAAAAKSATDNVCSEWWCIHKCHAEDNCDVVMTLDMGSSGTKPTLWAIKQDKDNKQIPEIRKIGMDGTKKDNKGKKFPAICGIWIDENQYQKDKGAFCSPPVDTKNGFKLGLKLVDSTKPSKKLKPGCFRNEDCGAEVWSCEHMYAKEKDWTKKGMEIYSNSASTTEYYDKWIKHFENQMSCFLDMDVPSGGEKQEVKKVKQYISGIYGGVTAGLRNDPDIATKGPKALAEGTEDGTGGDVWRILKSLSGMSPHLRMLSGEEEGYYEWLGFNWQTLRDFGDKTKGDYMQVVQDGLKNTLSIGGASAQIAIPTAQPMNTLDNTFYFHIGADKYWIYANSIMWGGTTRLANMVKKYAGKDLHIKEDDGTPPVNLGTENPKKLVKKDGKNPSIMGGFFEENNQLLCGDICQEPGCEERRLYKGVCVMGFHFPDPQQWLTTHFLGSKDFEPLIGTGANGCLTNSRNPPPTPPTIDLKFNENCDDPVYKAKGFGGGWWDTVKPTVTLPFYGRFFNELLKDTTYSEKTLEYSKADDLSWGAIWAAMWMHGKFQGFPNLTPVRNAAEMTANEFRRNLGGLKGEYTLGPLTIPAHFGTPEDKQ